MLRMLLCTIGLIVVALGAMTRSVADEQRLISIATASSAGVYFPVGGAVCRAMNRGTRQHGVRCSALTSEGSLDNLNALRENEVGFAIVQSDWLHQSYQGAGPFASSAPMSDLRVVAPLYREALTIVVRDDGKIAGWADLQNSRVDVGARKSGQAATMQSLLALEGWSGTVSLSHRLGNNRARALCREEVDAVVYMMGAPGRAVQSALKACDTRILSLPLDVTRAMIGAYPFYNEVTIEANAYQGQPQAVYSIGVTAYLVTLKSAAPALVRQMMASVQENFGLFRTSHPVLNGLDPVDLFYSTSLVPPHEGVREAWVTTR